MTQSAERVPETLDIPDEQQLLPVISPPPSMRVNTDTSNETAAAQEINTQRMVDAASKMIVAETVVSPFQGGKYRDPTQRRPVRRSSTRKTIYKGR